MSEGPWNILIANLLGNLTHTEKTNKQLGGREGNGSDHLLTQRTGTKPKFLSMDPKLLLCMNVLPRDISKCPCHHMHSFHMHIESRLSLWFYCQPLHLCIVAFICAHPKDKPFSSSIHEKNEEHSELKEVIGSKWPIKIKPFSSTKNGKIGNNIIQSSTLGKCRLELRTNVVLVHKVDPYYVQWYI